MSDRLKSTNQYSNEEIIDDLTKDLKSSLSTEDVPVENVINPDSFAADFASSSDNPTNAPRSSESSGRLYPDLDAEFEEENKSRPDSDTDSIDEVSLKDTEVGLTDDQKAERQVIAEELKVAGNEAFKVGDYDRSIEKYTEALRICPLQFSHQRSILYCNRSAAKMKLEQFAKAAKDCSKAIELNSEYLKAYLRRAQSYEATEKFDESLADYKKVLELDSSHKEAQRASTRLPPLIEQKNEKLKTEMIGKLKDLGNMILKPFGLSTENFQMEQDPDTKGYKINFKQ